MTSKSEKTSKGFFWALATYALPILMFPLICLVTHALTFETLVKVWTNPFSILATIVILLASFMFILRGYSLFNLWHKDPEQYKKPEALDSLQQQLVSFPKQILILGLILGMLIPSVLALLNQKLTLSLLDFVILGYANSIFFSMPCYIIFLQHFEHWNMDIPFSLKYLSMPLNLRVNLVSGFVLTSIMSATLIAFKNVMGSGLEGLDPWQKVLQVGLPITLVGLAGGVLNLFLLMRGISKRIHGCKDFVAQMSAGDVSCELINLTSRDELGVLAYNLNKVHQNMNTLLSSTRNSVVKTVSIKNDLLDICSVTAQEINLISEKISLVDVQSRDLVGGVKRALGRVETFKNMLEHLNDEINRQVSMVGETSSSISQMNQSIDTITQITGSRMKSSESLAARTEDGQEKMKLTLGHLDQISKSVETIRNITGVIQGIAAQTNLLSMNAAIEAAHAGQAGLGFSVVADEIRKLAQTAGSNSKEISKNIKEIIAVINLTLDSGSSTAETFGQVSRELQDFLKSFRQIDESLLEMRAGSQNIMHASHTLKSVSDTVQQDSDRMDKAAEELRSDIGGLEKVADTTDLAMNEVAKRVGEVNKASGNLKEHTVYLDVSTNELADSMGRFKIQEALA